MLGPLSVQTTWSPIGGPKVVNEYPTKTMKPYTIKSVDPM